MIRYLTAFLLLVSASVHVKADTVVPGEEHCVVHVASWDRLNIRTGPSSHHAIIARKRYGTCGIQVVAPCRDQWCPVGDGHVRGWAHRRYLDMISPALYCVRSGTPQEARTIRAYPSYESRPLFTLGSRSCDIAFLPYARDGWQKIRARGWEGWVRRKILSGE